MCCDVKSIVLGSQICNKGDPKTCAIFIPTLSSNCGYSEFSCNQNNCSWPGAYVTCIYCGLSVKKNTRKLPHSTWRSRICFAFVFSCGPQKPEYPQFEPHGWRRHYTGRCTRSGISLVYLWLRYSLVWGYMPLCPMLCHCPEPLLLRTY